MIYSENVPWLLSRYPIRGAGIELLSHKGHKAVWRVAAADMKEWIVKKLPYDERNIAYMLAAVRHLRSRGVLTPAVLQTLDGEDFAVMDGEHYVVFEAVQGVKPSYKRPEELAAIMRGMAGFHKASAGFTAPASAGQLPSRMPEAWAVWRREQRERLRVLRDEVRARRTELSEFDVLFRRVADGLIGMCDASMAGLAAVRYDKWERETLRSGMLCHLDFAATNLSLAADGRLQVIDMDTVAVEVPCVDIRKIVNKVMRRLPAWDLDMMISMLKSYQEEHPLTRQQLLAVASDVQFPHLALEQIFKSAGRSGGAAGGPSLSKVRRLIATDLSKGHVLRAFASRVDEVLA